MWVMDKDMSDDLLQYWWTYSSRGDLQSKMIYISIIGPEVRAYKRTWDESCGGNMDQIGNDL